VHHRRSSIDVANDIANIIRDNQKEFRVSAALCCCARVHDGPRALQEREERLRDTAESNNFRTMFFTLCKIALCVGIFGFTQVCPMRLLLRAAVLTCRRRQFNSLAAALKKRNS
jgi:hypothetical protein